MNTLEMIDSNSHDKGYDTKGVSLFELFDRFKKPPEKWTRKEKLAYIEYQFSMEGQHNMWTRNAICSRGLSRKQAVLAIKEGLRLYYGLKK